MISESDISRSALAMVKRYKDDAMIEASARADQLLDEGDIAGAEIERLDPLAAFRLGTRGVQ